MDQHVLGYWRTFVNGYLDWILGNYNEMGLPHSIRAAVDLAHSHHHSHIN